MTEPSGHDHEHRPPAPPLEGRIAPPPLPDERHQCHHGCDCWQRGFARYVELTPQRSPQDLDYQEAHALEVARNRAARDLRSRQAMMSAGNERVIRAHGALDAALIPLRSLAGRDVLAQAARRHADRIDDDSPGPPLWLRVLQWPVLLGAGAFDTWYFMQIFQQISLGNSQANWLETLVSAAPGLVLAAGLVVAGYSVGGQLHRTLTAHEEAQSERTGLKRRLCALWPWTLRLALPMMLILVTGVWGVVRALDAKASTPLLPARLVALLVVALAVCAISVKAAAHDPHAERVARARRRLWGLQIRLHLHTWRAYRRLVACRSAWSDQCALRDSLVGRVRGRFGEAYEFMTYARSFHGKAGELPPPFRRGGAADPGAADLNGWIDTEFTDVDQPVPEWDALREVQRVIVKYDPEPLAAELRELIDQVNGQLAVPHGERTGGS